MSFLAQNLAVASFPPKDVWAQAVDATSRSYNISTLTANGEVFTSGDWVVITISAETAAVFYALDTAARTIADGTVVAAGAAPAYASTSCYVLPAGTERSHLINRATHKFLMLKTAAGTATVRFFYASPTG